MLEEWLNYFWALGYSYFGVGSPKQISGGDVKYPVLLLLAYFLWDVFQRQRNQTEQEEEARTSGARIQKAEKDKPVPPKTKDNGIMEVAEIAKVKEVSREEESSEETTLSESMKDLGHTKVHEKNATFEGSQTSKVVQESENAVCNIESSSSVVQSQSVSQSVSSSSKVFSSKLSTSQSFSSEEVTEYEEVISS